MSQFQQTVNVYNPLGIAGEIAFSGPQRSKAANIYSAGVPNYFGFAYTLSNPATAEPSLAAPNGATATVGGTGVFAGIMTGVKQAYLSGTTAGGPLGATLAALDYSVQELTTMGSVFVSLPGPANVGDLITYDPLTGALNSVAPTVAFTGSIAAGGSAGVADVLTVTAVATAGGKIAVGQVVTGTGVEPATIISLGSGTGFTGTYNLSTINQQTVSSTNTLRAGNVPPPAFVGTATFATNVMTVATLASGEILIGTQVFGVGIPANTVVTALGTGTGGTGTYTLNQTVGTITPAIAVTGPANLFVPNAVVERYAANTAGGVAVIKLTN